MPNFKDDVIRASRKIKEDGTFINLADKIDAIHKALVTDKNAGVSLTGSNATDAVAVTPNDGADLATKPTKGIYLGASGDVKLTLNSGNTVTFTNLSSGVIHPIAAKRIWATGTTAGSILAVY